MAQRNIRNYTILGNEQPGVIRTKMASALINAVDEAIAKGKNPGRIGGLVVRANAKGSGKKFVPGEKKKHKAESAVSSINGHRKAAAKGAAVVQHLMAA